MMMMTVLRRKLCLEEKEAVVADSLDKAVRLLNLCKIDMSLPPPPPPSSLMASSREPLLAGEGEGAEEEVEMEMEGGASSKKSRVEGEMEEGEEEEEGGEAGAPPLLPPPPRSNGRDGYSSGYGYGYGYGSGKNIGNNNGNGNDIGNGTGNGTGIGSRSGSGNSNGTGDGNGSDNGTGNSNFASANDALANGNSIFASSTSNSANGDGNFASGNNNPADSHDRDRRVARAAAFNNRAILHIASGRGIEGCRLLRSCLLLLPGEPRPAFNLALALWRLGRPRAACVHWLEARGWGNGGGGGDGGRGWGKVAETFRRRLESARRRKVLFFSLNDVIGTFCLLLVLLFSLR